MGRNPMRWTTGQTTILTRSRRIFNTPNAIDCACRKTVIVLDDLNGGRVRMADARSLLRATRLFAPQDHQKAMVEAKLLG